MMDGTVSVSKGVFVFKNNFKSSKGKKKRGKKHSSQIDTNNIFAQELWYHSYHKLWARIENKIEALNSEMFSSVLSNLITFVSESYGTEVNEIPTAALLTGINMPDHGAQFGALSDELHQKATPHVATLSSQDCGNLKSLAEHAIEQFINEADDSDYEEDEDERRKLKIRKNQCSFSLLQGWYEELYPNGNGKNLVVIIPEFESFNEKVLQDFILIASSYVNRLPIVLIFGVATNLTVLHKSLPYVVSSKVNIRVFNSQPSTLYLNNVLENVFFSDECPFRLGGKLFTLFTDIFLFYDFSVTGFIQNFKFAMLEHFSNSNINALCTETKYLNQVLEEFKPEDFNQLRELKSFRKLNGALYESEEELRELIKSESGKIHTYLKQMLLMLKCLKILASDLPNAPLGKQLREMYNTAVSGCLVKSEEFLEAFKLLGFQSKDELKSKLAKCVDVLRAEKTNSHIAKVADELNSLLLQLDDESEEESAETEKQNDVLLEGRMDRKALKEKLLQMSRVSKPLNKYEKNRKKVIDYLRQVYERFIPEPESFVLNEIFFYNDVSIQDHIIGCHRAAIHTALNDPHAYLQCDCCQLPNGSTILASMPDVCIAYKLHLEYGKMINLYDWLQAFLSILDPVGPDEEDAREVDPRLQARFTQCVAELEFLGFVKSSKRKADHVARLTWGG